MSAGFDAKEQVRQAINIVDLVGDYLQLSRQGRRFVARCPWHDDHRPSLQVDPDQQYFKCWVCDLGGDIFTFVMKMEGLEFREALELLADRAGIDVRPAKTGTQNPADDRKLLLATAAWAEDVYHRFLLNDPAAEPARDYLRNRQISDDSIKRFHLGYAPESWQWLLSKASEARIQPAVLESLGLVAPRPSGGFYDRFRGRVLFPIHDPHGRSIAIGGRVLPGAADDVAKYVNSPETRLFSKSQQLYGLDLARDAITRARTAIVVEGYTDCIAAHQYGVENVVAVLGTALTERHVQILGRLADSITLVLDGDEAGQRRANEVLELFVAQQVELKILTLPPDTDPCDFLVSHGSDAFGQLVAKANDALEHKIRTVTKGLDLTAGSHQANLALEEVLGTLALAPRLSGATSSAARLREHQFLSRIARQFYVGEDEVRSRLTALRRRRQRSTATSEAQPEPKRDELHPWDRCLLELTIAEPELLGEIDGIFAPEDLLSTTGREILGQSLELYRTQTEPNLQRLLLEWEDAPMQSLLISLSEGGLAKEDENRAGQLREIVDRYNRRREDALLKQKLADLKNHQSQQEGKEEETLIDLLHTLRARHGSANPTEG